MINKTDVFESTDSLEAMDVFIEKIANGSLQIRQTLHPDHSKMYIFYHSEAYSQGGLLPGTAIMGSSNLTMNGLRQQRERNIIIRDSHTVQEMSEDFEYMRENDSIPLTQGGDHDEVVTMIKEETRFKLTNPYYCYLRLLYEYFTGDLTRKRK